MQRYSPLNSSIGVHIVCPRIEEGSVTLAMTHAGVISSDAGSEHLLELEFDGNRQAKRADFRPDLPLVFKW
jgi:hypothetical protein